MNIKLGSQQLKKCRWFQLVDEFMFDRAIVISCAYASAQNADELKATATSITNIIDQKSGEITSKSPKPKRNPDVFMQQYITEIRKSSKSLTNTLKFIEEAKMSLLISIQETIQKLVDKL